MTALAAAPSIVDEPQRRRGATALVAVPDRFAPEAALTTAHSLWSPMSESPHGEQTLDDLVAGVWEELAVRGLARCPVCAGEMLADITPAESVGASGPDAADEPLHAILSGACQDCGTRLD